MASEKYRAEMSHSINHEQVNVNRTFWAQSKKVAREKFRNLLKADSSIQEAGLFRERDNKLTDEYNGYV